MTELNAVRSSVCKTSKVDTNVKFAMVTVDSSGTRYELALDGVNQLDDSTTDRPIDARLEIAGRG